MADGILRPPTPTGIHRTEDIHWNTRIESYHVNININTHIMSTSTSTLTEECLQDSLDIHNWGTRVWLMKPKECLPKMYNWNCHYFMFLDPSESIVLGNLEGYHAFCKLICSPLLINTVWVSEDSLCCQFIGRLQIIIGQYWIAGLSQAGNS